MRRQPGLPASGSSHPPAPGLSRRPAPGLSHHPAPGTSDHATPSLDELAVHVRSCSACAARHARCLAEAEALAALRSRELPVDSLEGFYEDICEKAPYVTPGGGMSRAFLDAPRSLRLWRRVAVAASLLLAVGTGYALSGGFASGGAEAEIRRLHDPRDELLPAYREMDRVPLRSGFHVYPVFAPPSRGHDRFFEPAVGRDLVDPLDGEGDVLLR